MRYITRSSAETRRLGAHLAKAILSSRTERHAKTILLTGDLGSGKTTFTQGFLAACGYAKKVTSPTFVVMKRYVISRNDHSKVYHADLYRFSHSAQLDALGFEHIFQDPFAIVLIEWPKRAKNILPKKRIEVEFFHQQEENKRKITIRGAKVGR